ncbi:MAG: molybdopterin cofactor-binding domain-containing protein [Nitrososphaerota archaeon]
MKDIITLNINGETIYTPSNPQMTLLSFLREKLKLTGAKKACDGKGICGACTVIVNGKAVKSCLVRLDKALDGAQIMTIEGLSKAELHPLQVAFIKFGAIQCGYCTPGMILAAKALLDKNDNPTEMEIRRALQGNLCRCTGYVKIIQAVKEAAKLLRDNKVVKISIKEIEFDKEAIEKATGKFLFLDDLPADDALIAKVVWPQYPHARIRRIDASQAVKIPGVIKVLTAEDVPGQNAFGLIHEDQPVLCRDRVRYLGDPVALIIAETHSAATQAAELVRVHYEPLEAVFEVEDALAEGAPQLFPSGNIACKFVLKHGNADEALRKSSLVLSGEFRTPAIEHAYLETESGIAEWIDGKLVITSPCQHPIAVRKQVAKILNMPETMIRVISHPTGGAFGGKVDLSIQGLLALAAWHTKRKVKLVLSRAESLKMSVKRHPMILKYTIGFDAAGKICGLKARIIANVGAYHALSKVVLEQTTAFSTGPYRIPNVDVETMGVFTNTPPSSAMRGFGVPQPTFALESLLDEAARKLGMSPIDIRRINALRPGDLSPIGQLMEEDTNLNDVLEAIEEEYKSALKEKKEHNIGIGIACGYKNIGLGLGERDYTMTRLTLTADKVILSVGIANLGQGTLSTLAQMVANELELPYSCIVIEPWDTDKTPESRDTVASRSLVAAGNSVLVAVERLRSAVLEKAQEMGMEPPFCYSEGVISDCRNRRMTIFEIAKDSPIQVSGEFWAPETISLEKSIFYPGLAKPYFLYSYIATLAIVEANSKDGQIRIQRLATAIDAGRVINRSAFEGQVEGAVVMGIGYALSEQYVPWGPNMTDNLAKCGIPRPLDVPEIKIIAIEKGDSKGPYGAKGVGETALIPVAPAIANAIRDAIGVRFYHLPIKIRRQK